MTQIFELHFDTEASGRGGGFATLEDAIARGVEAKATGNAQSFAVWELTTGPNKVGSGRIRVYDSRNLPGVAGPDPAP